MVACAVVSGGAGLLPSMGNADMQRYRADTSKVQSDGAIVWRSEWLGGPSLARINNCRWESMEGFPRVTAYITGEADTWFSIPAVARYCGCRVRGYVTGDGNGNLVFRHCYY